MLARKGTVIDLLNNSKIISYSHLYFKGSNKYPVKIISTDSTGEGLLLLNNDKQSIFDNVYFSQLSNSSVPGLSLTGAVTIYESDVLINNCRFEKNIRGDDYLNIIRSNFEINNTDFINIVSDAFDADYSTGKISNTSFINCGNDAIDVSGSFISLDYILIDSIGDKAISAGEKSKLIGSNIQIINSDIGITSKDQSTVNLDIVQIDSTKLGYAVFQKKPEFGHAYMKIENSVTSSIEKKYLVDIESELIINDIIVINKEEDVESLLYGIKYGKSSK